MRHLSLNLPQHWQTMLLLQACLRSPRLHSVLLAAFVSVLNQSATSHAFCKGILQSCSNQPCFLQWQGML